MIITKLAGGLGNQMFQYAFGKAIATRNKVDLKLDISIFDTYDFHFYTLNHLNIQEHCATWEEIKHFRTSRRRSGLLGRLLNPLLADPKRYVSEPRYTFVPEMLDLKDPCYVDGYWQSEKYFADIAPMIHKEFSLRAPLGEHSRPIAARITAAKDAVAIHVRRGDFVTHPRFSQIHGARPLAYYEEAIQMIKAKVSSPRFFVFSDDPSWAKDNIKTDCPTEFVGQGPKKNYEDLELMRLCKHHIISNSTFGWWGAWLSEFDHDGITIAPTQWNLKFDSKDLVPERWIKLPF